VLTYRRVEEEEEINGCRVLILNKPPRGRRMRRFNGGGCLCSITSLP
jgi:hypothetical protein